MRVSTLVLSGVTGCESRALRYSAFEDLVVGSYTVRLFTNGECAVEMGLGYHEGRYTLQGDTIRLTYQEGPLRGMPTRLLLTPTYLVTLPSPEYPRSTRMHRQ
ncbi:hypothetical protein GCM10028824_35660 [Hymenobacter segetis]|uniref:Lipoprotein n=1 Tax=Hymenobacter segetis TaxID=2025509 RepID=A0ABU9LUH2_9BACT